MSKQIGAYSPGTDMHYDSWDDLVAAEANGVLVIMLVTGPVGKKMKTWPWVHGPYQDNADAKRARARLQRRMKRETADYPHHTYQFFIRPAWKDSRG